MEETYTSNSYNKLLYSNCQTKHFLYANDEFFRDFYFFWTLSIQSFFFFFSISNKEHFTTSTNSESFTSELESILKKCLYFMNICTRFNSSTTQLCITCQKQAEATSNIVSAQLSLP